MRPAALAPRPGGIVLLLAVVSVVGLLAVTVDAGAWLARVVEIQRALHRELAAALGAVRAQGPAAAGPLVALAFAYGVFHAAGPGHGKVVVATYLTTQKASWRRAVALPLAAALAQAATAIAAVHVLAVGLAWSLRATRGGVERLEPVSFALVAALGAYLALRAGWRLLRRHDDDAGHGCAGCAAHADARGRWGAVGVVAAVGARPCAGAVVVLVLAYASDLRLVGAAATLAMALGTAVTTSALALLAVSARRTAGRLAAALPGPHHARARLVDGIALAGGLVLLALGLALVQTALSTPAHPFR